METISPGHEGRICHRVQWGTKFGLTWSVLDREGARVVRRQQDFHERGRNLEGTSFRLIDLKGVCFSRWVLDHIYSRRCCSSLAEKGHYRPFYHQSFHSATAKDLWSQEGGCSDPRDIWRTNENMFGTLGRRKACCKGTGRLSWSNSDYGTSPLKAPGYNYTVRELVKPQPQRRAQQGLSRREFPLLLLLGWNVCCCVFCRWSYFYLLLHESLGWSSRNDYSETYFPLWYRNICHYDIEYSRIQRIPEWINSESEVFLPGN